MVMCHDLTFDELFFSSAFFEALVFFSVGLKFGHGFCTSTFIPLDPTGRCVCTLAIVTIE